MPRLRLLPEVTTIYTEQQAARVLTYLMNRGGPIAIDTETNGLDVMRSKVLCWSMATEDARYFIPIDFLPFFDRLFKRADINWYLANAKFDLHMLANMGFFLAGPVHDIVVMDAMDDDTRAHGLKEQSRIAYNVHWGEFKELFLDPVHVAQTLGLDKNTFGRFKNYSLGDKLLFVFAEQPHIVEDYASCDAYFTYLRATDLRTRLAAEELPTEMCEGFKTLYDYFSVIEVPFTKVLWKMERTGVPIDRDRIRKIDGPMRDGIRAHEHAIRQLVSPSFNPSSNDELADVLFNPNGEHRLTPVSYTTSEKKPKRSVAERDLKILQGRVKARATYELLEAVLQLRHLKKLHGTYVGNVEKILGPDGRIHCRYNQSGARTGRLSASEPNLQNIPIRNDVFHLRSMFVAPAGMHFLDCDYPQIQPRLAAVFAGEEKMLEAIRAGWDIHSANAANMYSHVDENATYESIEAAKRAKDMREQLGRALTELEKLLLTYRDGAKTVGLGVLFGEGPQKMAHQLKLPSVDDGKLLIKRFFDSAPKLKKLIDDTHQECHLCEYAYTMLGRIRRLHKINNAYSFKATAAERRAGFNHKIQGSEVEVMKLAMLQIDACPEWHALGGQLSMTVHDELCGFAPKDTSADALEVMMTLMEDPLQWGPISIRLPVSVRPDGGRGENWAEVH